MVDHRGEVVRLQLVTTSMIYFVLPFHDVFMYIIDADCYLSS